MTSKKIYAVTNIKHDNGQINAGEEVSTKTFDKETFLKLHGSGAIEIREVAEPEAIVADAVEDEDTSSVEPSKND